MDTKTLAKLRRLLNKFPETWAHTRESPKVDGVKKIFHHVDYRSDADGKKVRLVSHVSADMCELLVLLKTVASEFVEEAG